jgi:hypothetical protein
VRGAKRVPFPPTKRIAFVMAGLDVVGVGAWFAIT